MLTAGAAPNLDGDGATQPSLHNLPPLQLPDRDTLPSMAGLQWVGGSAVDLQPGPWLHNLRTLCLTGPAAWVAAVRGAPVLAAASRLEQLFIETSDLPDAVWRSPAWEAFWGWAVATPRLQRLEELSSDDWLLDPTIPTEEEEAELLLARERIEDAFVALAMARLHLRVAIRRLNRHNAFLSEVDRAWAAGDPPLYGRWVVD